MYKWLWWLMGLVSYGSAQSYEIYPAKDRGFFHNNWLQARYSFSFNTYENPNRMGFGALLVLNDDIIAPGKGFGKHSHENMEIITIPLQGTVKHKDNMGHEGTIGFGEVQVMSAGTGIKHSEYNNSEKDTLKSLQIWIKTDSLSHQPRYGQKKFNPKLYDNTLFTMVTPNDTSKLYIHNNASLSMGVFSHSQKVTYQKKDPKNGVYIFIIKGKMKYESALLETKDAVGINDFSGTLSMEIDADSQVLVIEVPME